MPEVSLSVAEVGTISELVLPDRLGLSHRTSVADISWRIDEKVRLYGQATPLSTTAKVRELLFTSNDGVETAIALKAPSSEASAHPRILRARNASLADGVLDLTSTGKWLSDPARINFSVSTLQAKRSEILASWEPGITYRVGGATSKGFRRPQIGALHAIAAHWTVSNKVGTIVMPTGTGKTEVMVATLLAGQCRSVLVVVPSDALRNQTARKFQTLGMLREIGVIPPTVLFPIVGVLRHIPKTDADLEVFDVCHIVVTTMAALGQASSAVLGKIAQKCSHLFIDEAHHTPAETWNDLRERFAQKPTLQFTATPFRRDGRRLDGLILYNYPLAKAQEEGYFQPIRFEEVWEWDPEAADEEIARVAIARLRQDLADNLDHMMMARADNIARAEALFDTIYSKYPDLSPVVVHNRTPRQRQVLEAIKGRQHRIVVCVDMLGEGFDLPQLKIAALHDAHRSLGVTLQFTGRFTRNTQGIGDATVVANLADRKVSESLEDLYSENADWNALLPNLSIDAIRPQQHLSNFIAGTAPFSAGQAATTFTAATLDPKTSTLIYHSTQFRPRNFINSIPDGEEIYEAWENHSEQLLVFVTRKSEQIEWARTKSVTDVVHNLYVVYYDAPKQLLFIHSSIKSTHRRLAAAVGAQVRQLGGEDMFRVYGGLQRIIFYNAGLLGGRGSSVRFQMFAGMDVAKAIDPVQQQDFTKSNLFGAGYENGRRVTVGCSQKGTVWSLQTSSVPDWMNWCQEIGAKLLDHSIATTAYLEHTLIPELITALPSTRPLCIEWPDFAFERIEKGLTLLHDGQRVSWLDCDLDLTAWTAGDFEFVVSFPDQTTRVTCRAALNSEGALTVRELPESLSFIHSADLRQSVAEFFAEHPPLLRFESGAELIGSRQTRPRNPSLPHFPADSLTVHGWAGVNITRESKWRSGIARTDSIQGYVIEQLLADPSYALIVDDDDSGEAADVVAIRDAGDRVEVHLFHCKYSGSEDAGSRADDLYVVCGQAQKAVAWTSDFKRLAEHIIHREKISPNQRPTRLERGTLRDLRRIQRASRKAPAEYTMIVVQPGLSKTDLNPRHSAMLGATSLFLRQRLGTPLQVWVSA